MYIRKGRDNGYLVFFVGLTLLTLLSSCGVMRTLKIRCAAPDPPSGLDPDIIVSARYGDDVIADGDCTPYRTVTAAMKAVKADEVVWVAPGIYDAERGEKFPIQLPPGVTLVGDEANKGSGPVPTVIIGSGPAYKNYHATIKGAGGAGGTTVSGLAIRTGDKKLLRFGIYSADAGITIRNNNFSDSYGGVTLHGGGDPLVEGNVFKTSAYGVYTHCLGTATIRKNDFIEGSYIDNVHGDAIIKENNFSGNSYRAISVQYGNPLVEGNSFHASYVHGALSLHYEASPVVRGNRFEVQGGNGVQIKGQAQPDLGTASDPGGNVFTGTGGTAIVNESGAVVYAVGNRWNSDKPVCGTDIKIVKSGKVVWGAGAGESCD
ncbi:MAG: DUF1565 domain-containing protein [Thermodesulfobacteriota bacterium]